MRDAYLAHHAGKSEAELAAQYAVSDRTIRRWVKRGKEEEWDKQPIELATRRRA